MPYEKGLEKIVTAASSISEVMTKFDDSLQSPGVDVEKALLLFLDEMEAKAKAIRHGVDGLRFEINKSKVR